MTADFALANGRTGALAVLDRPNELPRSVVRGTGYELLDGEWRFELDLEDRGLAGRWYLGHDYHGTARWPGSIESQLREGQELQQHTPPWQDQVIAWYEREFTIPAAWCDDPFCLTQLTFGACGYETRVWLNGHPLETIEGQEVHFGEYSSFSYELPPERLAPDGRNRLTVRVADSLDAEIPRGKQESRVYKRGGIWYQTVSGPVRSVWLEPVERNRLRSRLDVLSQLDDGLVELTLTLRIRDPGIYTLRLALAPHAGEGPDVADEFRLALEAGEQRQRLALQLPGATPWSPENPRLYHLLARMSDPRGRASEIATHFGLRTVRARGRSFSLNGRALYLDGILYQPGTAGYEEMRRHLLAIKRLGCNLARVHIAGIDPRIYDLADELGLLLWIEVPSPHSSSQRSRANHWDELQGMLQLIGSHPSIAIWSLYNEDWGAQDIATSAETRAYIARVYDYMRLNHPQVLVVDNDGWHHLSVEGRLMSDLLTAHLYTPDLAHWRELLDAFAAGRTEGVAARPLVVGDPFFYRGQLPLVVSEWGGFGFAAYGGPHDPEARAAKIAAFKAELRARPLAGDVYTQAISIEDEDNGLIDPHTGDLLVPEGLLGSGTGRGSSEGGAAR